VIAIDTSTLVAYLAGQAGADADALDLALAHNRASLPPIVVTEILSAPAAPRGLTRLILALPALGCGDGYWERAGRMRRRVLARGLRAPLADALICQSCLDHDVALLTRDRDFKHFATHCGLKLA
jgi:hypothetical protein